MTCDERRVVAYLAGELDDEDRATFERHLLGCEDCWSSVREDRRGRELAEQLRSLAPAGLRDRIRAGVDLAAAAGPRPRRRRVAVVLVAAALVAIVGGASVVLSSRRAGDPPVVAEVLELAASHADPMPPRATNVLGGEPVRLTVEHAGGEPVVMAHAAVAFPMAAKAMPLGNDSDGPWMAHRSDMTLLALSTPEHVLLIARVPPGELLAFARDHGFEP